MFSENTSYNPREQPRWVFQTWGKHHVNMTAQVWSLFKYSTPLLFMRFSVVFVHELVILGFSRLMKLVIMHVFFFFYCKTFIRKLDLCQSTKRIISHIDQSIFNIITRNHLSQYYNVLPLISSSGRKESLLMNDWHFVKNVRQLF